MLATLLVFATGAAHAADYPQPPPAPPPYIPPPPQQECCDSWYLRGFVGVGMNGNYSSTICRPRPMRDFAFDSSSIADTMFIGGGVGYEWNNWLRFEVTGEYRAKSRVYAFGHYTSGGGYRLDTYEGYLKSWVFLANAFVDLGTWNCFTPFVGVGIGGAYNTLADFTDVNPIGAASASAAIRANGIWPGRSMPASPTTVSKNFKIDLTYRYLNYGSITDTVDCYGGCNPRLVQVQESLLARHHARPALDLLRYRAAAAALRLPAAALYAAAAAVAEPGVSRALWLTPRRHGENLWLSAA